MKYNFVNQLLVFVLLIAFLGNASQEGALKISDLNVKSNGIGNSGQIQIIGKANSNSKSGYDLKVIAFLKEIPIPDSILSQIDDFKFNGIRISYEQGYKDSGGKTLYIIFEFGFYSSIRREIKLTIKENGSISVYK